MLTRRDLIIKWSVYGGAALLLVLLYTLTLRDAVFFGVHLFLPPLLVGIVASVEDTRSGMIFALVFGVLCDLSQPGTFPCVYTLAFTCAAISCSYLARSVLQPGPLCSIAVALLTFLHVDALNMLALRLRDHAAFLPMASVALREMLFSCVLLLICHPVLMFLHRRLTL